MFNEEVMIQQAPWPYRLFDAVEELRYLPGWQFYLKVEDLGQRVHGLALNIVPNNPDSYHPDKHANTRFPYPVPAAAYNRESWEEWIWDRIEETEGHERSEAFKFVDAEGNERRPFKPAHQDGWNPGVVRTVVSDTVTNTPNAGRLVEFPCRACTHFHNGKMGEHFQISEDRGCVDENCACGKTVGARSAEDGDEVEVFVDGLRFATEKGDYSGLDIRHFMHPPLSDDYVLYLGHHVVEPTDTFTILKDGLRFDSKRIPGR